ncbi:hypothetical protein NGF75_16895 [Dietzia kunjamensis]|uniref:hypothetical protein n=1 Tax=Dietzia kunjamensis TaxID=322509 RepID=UPI002DB813FB|nr:hypothetical protein [Dietzia kunjamensis]MEB8327649.1 hypothetical protein [Dietzia kunjamensis]
MSVRANPAAQRSTARRGKGAPVVRSRVGGPVAFAGLAIALLSLYLPWVAGGGESFSGLVLPEVLGLREITPVNFLGLVGLSFLSAVVLVSRLGIFAILNAVTASLVLIAHLAFVYVLYGSTGTADPILSGLPMEMTVTYGPYVAVVGFLMVIAGSAVAATSAEYMLPDRAEARMRDRD